jgi:SAM-dependent methyltransferase
VGNDTAPKRSLRALMDHAASTLPCAGDGHTPQPRTVLCGCDRWHGIDGVFAVVRCVACGLASTEPRLSGEALARYYPSDYYTNVEPEAPVEPSGINRLIAQTRQRLLERFGPFRDLYAARPGRLLDVGCGSGGLAAEFIARGWSATGIEPSEAAARAARGRGVEMHVGTLADAPFAPGSFDAVTFNHSLEHVPDPLGDLRAAARLAKPGGIVAVSVPNFGSWERRVFGSRWFQLDLPRHLNHFDRNSLAALAGRAGLDVRRTWSSSNVVSLPGSLQYAVRGRMAWGEGTLYRLGYLLWPLEQPLDRLLGGDCLHMVARASGSP